MAILVMIHITPLRRAPRLYHPNIPLIRAAGGRLELEIPSLGYWSGLISWMRLRIGAVQLGECYTLVSLAGDAERETGAEQLYTGLL